MASLLITRGLHSLIASRDSPANKNVAWGSITIRDTKKELNTVVLCVLVLANLVVFVPAFFVLVYTLNRLYPTLAIVEADTPPEYELVAGKEADINEDRNANAGSTSKDTIVPDNSAEETKSNSSSAKLMPDETAGVPSTPSQPITSGLIATLRFLHKSRGGLFTAYRWRFLYNLVAAVVFTLARSVPFMPLIVASIIASLAATKVETAWTHAAVSTQRDSHLWKKLPSYFSILKATAIPLIAEAVLAQIVTVVSFLPMGPRTGSVDPLGVLPSFAHSGSFMRLSVTLVLFVTLYTTLLVPTEVILTRTRAAMLPEEVNTLVQLDSSIRAQEVEQMGFMSWIHAWQTFSRASWIRISKTYAKIFCATFLTEFVCIGLIGVEVLVYSLVMQGGKPH